MKWSNDYYYTPWLKDNKWVQTFDAYLVRVLKGMGISRAKLRHGCFIQGTKIQVDKYGNTKNVELF